MGVGAGSHLNHNNLSNSLSVHGTCYVVTLYTQSFDFSMYVTHVLRQVLPVVSLTVNVCFHTKQKYKATLFHFAPVFHLSFKDQERSKTFCPHKRLSIIIFFFQKCYKMHLSPTFIQLDFFFLLSNTSQAQK